MPFALPLEWPLASPRAGRELICSGSLSVPTVGVPPQLGATVVGAGVGSGVGSGVFPNATLVGSGVSSGIMARVGKGVVGRSVSTTGFADGAGVGAGVGSSVGDGVGFPLGLAVGAHASEKTHWASP